MNRKRFVVTLLAFLISLGAVTMPAPALAYVDDDTTLPCEDPEGCEEPGEGTCSQYNDGYCQFQVSQCTACPPGGLNGAGQQCYPHLFCYYNSCGFGLAHYKQCNYTVNQ